MIRSPANNHQSNSYVVCMLRLGLCITVGTVPIIDIYVLGLWSVKYDSDVAQSMCLRESGVSGQMLIVHVSRSSKYKKVK